ncbi:Uma2 family endonuclease [Streptoalloteichus hindustanus]|uniref:Putative restriction endonuclease n=1 Tax=Streptoalloteichus hindustanus TaxID=2017 RepID=A0A1M5ANZ0_STRHI|nr:Uma2 family endonuclease [Streptoalloteichus hindustanus]SHF31874.1 Putative restriction endonuclease [Streptoalloteichus hindustanus]
MLALPEDRGHRVELVDGALVVSPTLGTRHQRVLRRLLSAFDTDTPADYEPLWGVNVVLSGPRLLVPDLAVVTEPGADVVCFPGDQVLLTVEVASPSTRVYDLTLKRELYTEAGIPHFLFADPGSRPQPPVIVAFDLRGGSYREVGRSRDGRLRVERPFPLALDLAERRQ